MAKNHAQEPFVALEVHFSIEHSSQKHPQLCKWSYLNRTTNLTEEREQSYESFSDHLQQFLDGTDKWFCSDQGHFWKALINNSYLEPATHRETEDRICPYFHLRLQDKSCTTLSTVMNRPHKSIHVYIHICMTSPPVCRHHGVWLSFVLNK